MQIVMPPDALEGAVRELRVGDRVSQEDVLRWALDHGFELTPLVHGTGPGRAPRRHPRPLPARRRRTRPPRLLRRRDRSHPRRSILTPSAPESACASFASCRPRSCRSPASAKPPTSCAQLDLGTLRPEVQSEWNRTIDAMAEGRTPASLDLFAPYLVDPAGDAPRLPRPRRPRHRRRACRRSIWSPRNSSGKPTSCATPSSPTVSCRPVCAAPSPPGRGAAARWTRAACSPSAPPAGRDASRRST